MRNRLDKRCSVRHAELSSASHKVNCYPELVSPSPGGSFYLLRSLNKFGMTKPVQHAGVIINLELLLIGITIIFAAAQVIIPLKPVPITLQTVAISLIGFTYSPRLSFLTVLSYLAIGAVGLPVFTQFGGGISHLTGATFGYLVGFMLAAPLMGIMKEKLSARFSNMMLNIVISSLVGHIIIYTLGVSWLSTLIGLKEAVYSGLLIYIPTGLAKIFAFSGLFSYVHGIKNRNI